MAVDPWYLQILNSPGKVPSDGDGGAVLPAETLPVAMILCDEAGKLLCWTHRAQDLLGDSLTTGLPDAMATLLTAAGVADTGQLVAASGDASQALVIRRGGRERMVHLSSRPAMGGQLLYILTDCTPTHPEAQEHAHLQSLIAHDLRSPLAVIQGYAGLLSTGQPGPLTPTQQEFLAGIDTKILEVSRLLDDFLDLSRLAAGGLELQLGSTKVGELLDQIIAEQKPAADSRQINLDIRLLPETITVQADPLRLHQILNNLIGNAIKYNLQGGWVAISAELSSDEAWVNLTVSDGGPGMDDDVCNRIFEPFQRGRDVPGVEGVGLGLVVVKKLVELHGGSITVDSEAGQGTRFTIAIPVGITIQEDALVPLEPRT